MMILVGLPGNSRAQSDFGLVPGIQNQAENQRYCRRSFHYLKEQFKTVCHSTIYTEAQHILGVLSTSNEIEPNTTQLKISTQVSFP